MRNTAMSETCTAVSRLLQEWVVFNVNSGMIIGVNMTFGMIIGHGPPTATCAKNKGGGGGGLLAQLRDGQRGRVVRYNQGRATWGYMN